MKSDALFLRIVFISNLFVWQVGLAQRGGIYVHGLNDNSSEWNHWEQLFSNERHMFDRNHLVQSGNWTDYDSHAGVVPMADNVRNDYNNTADNQSIYFGHSMGGVVGRDLDVRFTGDFGGIITVGSPLDGARVANATRNGEAAWAINNGLDRVLEGPVRELGLVISVSNFAVDFVVGFLVGILDVFALRDNGHLGAFDLQEGSSYMTSYVRNSQTSTAKIHIYGNEEGPAVWRLASHAVGNGDDNQYVSLVNTCGDVYEAAMWINYGIAFVNLISLNFVGAAWFTYIAVGWSDGMNWWRYDSERDWNHIIGADIGASNTVCYQQLNWQGFNDCMNQYAGQQATYEQYIQCQNQNTYQNCYTYYASQNGLSDAFIKAPSQAGFNSGWSSNATRLEAQGVNHLEMDDHPTMENIYNTIFDGNSGASGFFITPR